MRKLSEGPKVVREQRMLQTEELAGAKVLGPEWECPGRRGTIGGLEELGASERGERVGR